MRKLRRLTAVFLICTMFCSLLMPATNVQADTVSTEQEEDTSEEATTEQTTTEQATTEDSGTGQETTEETTEEENVDQTNFLRSELSPITAKVIVLDPGHCGKHPGASANGLKEEVVD